MSSTSPSPDPAVDDPGTGAAPHDPDAGSSDDDATLAHRAPAEDEPTAQGTTADLAPTEPDRAADGPERRVADVADRSRVRRAPKYGRFAFAGFLLGAAVSFGLIFLPGADDGLSARNLFFLLLLSLGSLGIVLGLATALWTDRRSLRGRR